jgi:hypothetical protein
VNARFIRRVLDRGCSDRGLDPDEESHLKILALREVSECRWAYEQRPLVMPRRAVIQCHWTPEEPLHAPAQASRLSPIAAD